MYTPVSRSENVTTIGGFSADKSNTDWEFKNICIPRFLASFEEAPVHSLEDIIKFNVANKEKCLPERELLCN